MIKNILKSLAKKIDINKKTFYNYQNNLIQKFEKGDILIAIKVSAGGGWVSKNLM